MELKRLNEDSEGGPKLCDQRTYVSLLAEVFPNKLVGASIRLAKRRDHALCVNGASN